MTRANLPNPDDIWPEERTFARIVAGQSEQHNQHLADIKALEQRLEAFGVRIDEVENCE